EAASAAAMGAEAAGSTAAATGTPTDWEAATSAAEAPDATTATLGTTSSATIWDAPSATASACPAGSALMGAPSRLGHKDDQSTSEGNTYSKAAASSTPKGA